MVQESEYLITLVIQFKVDAKNQEEANEKAWDAIHPLDCEILAEGMDRLED
jgi:hypothetical protein